MYFDPEGEGFILKREGEQWQKQFPRLAEAVDYACSQLQGTEGRLMLFNEAGEQISEVAL